MIKYWDTKSQTIFGFILVVLCYMKIWRWILISFLLTKFADKIIKISKKIMSGKVMLDSPLTLAVTFSSLFASPSRYNVGSSGNLPEEMTIYDLGKGYRREFYQNLRGGKFEGMSTSEILKKSSEAEKMDWAAIQRFKAGWDHFYKESLMLDPKFSGCNCMKLPKGYYAPGGLDYIMLPLKKPNTLANEGMFFKYTSTTTGMDLATTSSSKTTILTETTSSLTRSKSLDSISAEEMDLLRKTFDICVQSGKSISSCLKL